MEIIDGKITDYDKSGKLTVTAMYDNADKFIKCGYSECRVLLKDSREISHEQRKKAYALLNEIAEFMGEMPDYVKKLFKLKFIYEEQKGLADALFSLSGCSVTEASDFITYLVDFILAHDIPTRIPLVELCDDVRKYVYACLMHKKCVVCGRRGELHHVDAVGMGNDRNEIHNLNREALCLCREHHAECHTTGLESFKDKYHLVTIKLDKKLCKVYKIKE